MQCCVPFCKFSENALYTHGTDGKKITFHRFPSDLHLRAAWMRALGRQDIPLSEPAVVCSQHFLHEEMYETENGSKQLKTDAIPSTVQVCMICLDTESRQFLMKHKLVEAYQHLTGNPPCDLGNLKQTVCVHCAQSLRNFTRLRERSLKAEELMMDLVQQHQLITKQHIKRVNRAKHRLTNNMVLKTLKPNHCDLHIIVEEKQTESEAIRGAVVKTETNYDPMSDDEDVTQYQEFRVKVELDPLKCETTPFQCKICYEEFADEHTYIQHLTLHTKNGCGAGESDASPRARNESAQRSSDDPHELSDDPHDLSDDPGPSGLSPNTSVGPLFATLETNKESKVRKTEEVITKKRRKRKLDIKERKVQKTEEVITKKRSKGNLDIKNSKVHKTEEVITEKKRKRKLDINKCGRTYPGGKLFTCDICQKVCKLKSHLIVHIRTHTGDKPFSCTLCDYKCSVNDSLVSHMTTHTGEKPYSCKLCEYKCSRKSYLVSHMRTHTGEKPFSCTLCDYKCTVSSSLVSHMRTHTGEKPYSCKLCEYKCSLKLSLVNHIRSHTGEKPFSCTLCDYKCKVNSSLVAHMRTHTGEKPFSCVLCEFKCSLKCNLVQHMKTHTGEKPFSCNLCEYKCKLNRDLKLHLRSHTGEKPYTCHFCEFKCASSSHLAKHSKKHSSAKLY